MADGLTPEACFSLMTEILKALQALEARYWSEHGDEEAERSYRLYEYFSGVTDEPRQVVERLKSEEYAPGWRVPLWEPGDPTCALAFHIPHDCRAASIQLAVVLANPEDGFHWLCARFESPERLWHEEEGEALPEGVHDYPHVQISAEVRASSLRVGAQAAPTWLEANNIAPPLPARDPIDLILCALLAVRHPEFLRSLAEHSSNGEIIQRVAWLVSEAPPHGDPVP